MAIRLRSTVRTRMAIAVPLVAIVIASASLVSADSLTTVRVASGLTNPLYVTAPPGDTSRLFIVEQGTSSTGRIKILDLATGVINATSFLEVSGITTGGERGLLGLAFHPQYATNGLFYVNFTDAGGATNVRRYQVSANPNVANAGSAQTVLTFTQPESNHNGGWLGFSPNDGNLYIASGDGGGANDQHGAAGNGQNTNTLLGKMLRIDVNSDAFPADPNTNYAIPPTNPFAGAIAGRDEIWHTGLRNPWRAAFDRANGDLYIGDVGQGAREEIDFQSGASPQPLNYGWRVMEGTRCNISTDTLPCNHASFTPPIAEYTHQDGISVTGGYVYRGSAIPGLAGTYFYADYGSARIWSFRYDGTTRTQFTERTPELDPAVGNIDSVSSFGEDGAGNLYIVDYAGEVYRIDRSPKVEFVSSGDEWRYLANGSNQGTAWRQSIFPAESSWPTGRTQMGYGDGLELTVVPCGGTGGCTAGNYITTYFRKTFTVSDPSLVDSLVINLMRDDGAAVYINGTEVVRTNNLPPNPAYNTLADLTAAINGAAEYMFTPTTVNLVSNPNLLRQGDNVIAVEMHQAAQNSSDISFDLELTATLLTPTPGDADLDGDVDRRDAAIVASHYGRATKSQWIDGDFNGDQRVSLADLALLQQNFGTTGPAPSAVPEPSSIGLLVFGLCAVGFKGLNHIRRRRKAG